MVNNPQIGLEDEMIDDPGDRIMNLLIGWDNAIQECESVKASALLKRRDDCRKEVMEALPLDGKEHRFRFGPYLVHVKAPNEDKTFEVTRHGNHRISLEVDNHGG